MNFHQYQLVTSFSRSMLNLGCSTHNSRWTSEHKCRISSHCSWTHTAGLLKNFNPRSVTPSRCGQMMGHTFMTLSWVWFVSLVSLSCLAFGAGQIHAILGFLSDFPSHPFVFLCISSVPLCSFVLLHVPSRSVALPSPLSSCILTKSSHTLHLPSSLHSFTPSLSATSLHIPWPSLAFLRIPLPLGLPFSWFCSVCINS